MKAMFDYTEHINKARRNENYFEVFSGFTMRRLPDAICIDTEGKSDKFSLDANAQVINRMLHSITYTIIKS